MSTTIHRDNYPCLKLALNSFAPPDGWHCADFPFIHDGAGRIALVLHDGSLLIYSHETDNFTIDGVVVTEHTYKIPTFDWPARSRFVWILRHLPGVGWDRETNTGDPRIDYLRELVAVAGGSNNPIIPQPHNTARSLSLFDAWKLSCGRN